MMKQPQRTLAVLCFFIARNQNQADAKHPFGFVRAIRNRNTSRVATTAAIAAGFYEFVNKTKRMRNIHLVSMSENTTIKSNQAPPEVAFGFLRAYMNKKRSHVMATSAKQMLFVNVKI